MRVWGKGEFSALCNDSRRKKNPSDVADIFLVLFSRRKKDDICRSPSHTKKTSKTFFLFIDRLAEFPRSENSIQTFHTSWPLSPSLTRCDAFWPPFDLTRFPRKGRKETHSSFPKKKDIAPEAFCFFFLYIPSLCVSVFVSQATVHTLDLAALGFLLSKWKKENKKGKFLAFVSSFGLFRESIFFFSALSEPTVLPPGLFFALGKKKKETTNSKIRKKRGENFFVGKQRRLHRRRSQSPKERKMREKREDVESSLGKKKKTFFSLTSFLPPVFSPSLPEEEEGKREVPS